MRLTVSQRHSSASFAPNNWLVLCPLIVLRGILEQLLGTAAKINIGQNHLRLEDDSMVIGADIHRLKLFSEVSHVIGKAQEVLCIVAFAGLAGDLKLFVPIRNCAPPFNGQHVGVGDAVVEHNAAVNLKIVRCSRQVHGCYARVVTAC